MSSCSSIICRAHISTNSTKMVFKTVQWTVIPFQFRLVVFFMAFTICVLDAMCPARRLIWLYFSFIYCWQSSDAVTIVTDVAFWCVENVGKASNRNINFRLLVWIIEQQIVPATLPHQPPSPVTILQKNDEICEKTNAHMRLLAEFIRTTFECTLSPTNREISLLQTCDFYSQWSAWMCVWCTLCVHKI